MFFFVLIFLCLMRFQDLALKPVHHDESINGWFVMQLWQEGWYNYDPSNYHGPLLFYLFALGESLGGWGIVTLRAVTVLFSVFWLLYLWNFFKRYQWPSRWFVLVLALSPAFMFYSRSAIHEMPFVFFMTLSLGGLTELLHYSQRRGWLTLIWGVAGMILLKETWALLAASLVFAAIIMFVVRRPRLNWDALKLRWESVWHERAALHIALALTLIVVLFTGFGQKPSGLIDLFAAYIPWMKTGTGENGHEKSLFYWLDLLWTYEKPLFFLFLGLLSSVVLFAKRISSIPLWLGLTAVLNLLLYSLIPYKTPWCILAVFTPMIFAYGLLKKEVRFLGLGNPTQHLFTLLALVALFFQWPEMQELNFKNPANKDHRYVYVQSDTRLKNIVDQLISRAEVRPELYAAKIQLAGTEPWPLSWWLSPFANHVLMPIKEGLVEDAVLVLVDVGDRETAQAKIPSEKYDVLEFPIREGRENSLYYIRRDIMDPKFKTENFPSGPDSTVKEGER